MGGHKQIKLEDNSPLELIMHPSFKFPRVPDFLTMRQNKKVMAVVDYVIESVAKFLSPSPKIEDENQEFAYDDLAEALRRHIGPRIKQRLKEANKTEMANPVILLLKEMIQEKKVQIERENNASRPVNYIYFKMYALQEALKRANRLIED